MNLWFLPAFKFKWSTISSRYNNNVASFFLDLPSSFNIRNPKRLCAVGKEYPLLLIPKSQIWRNIYEISSYVFFYITSHIFKIINELYTRCKFCNIDKRILLDFRKMIILSQICETIILIVFFEKQFFRRHPGSTKFSSPSLDILSQLEIIINLWIGTCK